MLINTRENIDDFLNHITRDVSQYKNENYVKKIYNMFSLCNINTIHIKKEKILDPDNHFLVDKYFSSEIRKKVKNSNTKYEYTLISNNKKRNIVIRDYDNIGEKSIYYNYLHHIIFFVCFFDNLNVNYNNDTLNIYIYLMNDNKYFINEGEIFQTKHINTGLSSKNKHGTIIIYRKEEWLKTLIHELIHSYEVDLYLFNTEIFKTIIPLDVEENEAYVETWARILNIGYITYIQNREFKDFKDVFIVLLEVERLHSLMQGKRLLKSQNLKYKNIKNIVNFKEDTNTFCYYVVSSLFLFDYNLFMKTCEKYNKNLLITQSGIENIYRLLDKEDKDLHYIDNLNINISEKYFRMSFIDMN